MTNLIPDSLQSLSQSMRSAALLAAACFWFAAAGWAQSSSGVITGRVIDSSGLPVVEASVTLENTQTRDARSVPSSMTGEFVFQSVQPGRCG